MAQAQRCDTVTVHCRIRLQDGSVFVDTTRGAPLVLTMGAGQTVRGLEEAVVGMSPGESRTVIIPPDMAFGPYRPEAVTTVNRNQLPADLRFEVGKWVTLETGYGPKPMLVTNLSESSVTLDANHPLAGKDLNVDVQLVAINKPAMFSGFHNWTIRPAVRHADPVAGDIQPGQNAWELEQMLAVLERLKPTRILEIGCFQGGTLYHLIRLAQPGAKILAIDPACGPYEARWRSWLTDGKALHCFASRSQSAGLGDTVAALVGELDFLLIDGDHEYAGARADFCTYGPLVRAGGIIALHDICINRVHKDAIHVDILWREIREAGYVIQELYSSPAQPQMGIGLVYV
jgi:peptidylprolyl isomerase